MKNLFKRIIAAITAATLAAGSVPLNMTASAQLAPVKVNGHGMLSSVSEKYIGYIDSGEGNEVGAAPSMLDMSYLGESYAQLTQTANKKFPSSYDLRDYGRVSPVENQFAVRYLLVVCVAWHDRVTAYNAVYRYFLF